MYRGSPTPSHHRMRECLKNEFPWELRLEGTATFFWVSGGCRYLIQCLDFVVLPQLTLKVQSGRNDGMRFGMRRGSFALQTPARRGQLLEAELQDQ